MTTHKQPLWQTGYIGPRPQSVQAKHGYAQGSLPFVEFDRKTGEPLTPYFVCELCEIAYQLAFMSQHPQLVKPDDQAWKDDPSRTVCKLCTHEKELT